MANLAKQGSAVIMISQDLEEIFQIAHHIAVLNNGQLSETLKVDDVTPEHIGLLMGESPTRSGKARSGKARVSS